MDDDIEDEGDDDWCEHCGSEDCEGECLRVPVGELPGEHLERIARESRDRTHNAVQELLANRLYPEEKPEKALEDFEREMARRPKVEIGTRRDGTQYRKRV